MRFEIAVHHLLIEHQVRHSIFSTQVMRVRFWWQKNKWLAKERHLSVQRSGVSHLLSFQLFNTPRCFKEK